MKKIAIASDHGGYEYKKVLVPYLKEKGYQVFDLGTNSDESCDYPIYASKVCDEILNGCCELGILICGTGIGMSIAANRNKGIRASVVSDVFSAKMTRMHNNSNVLCLGARVLGIGLVKELVDVWLETDYIGSYHEKRIQMLDL
ncbi:MAG: ribose 5-phosphate isomerase B [Candidatus Gastranaerophilales bacterium]|nr:ribose 5-phosphate isomerase B [Candidatus Gastranaerophilales bacterium]